MFNLPNILSLCRIPLALVFLQENPNYRGLAIVLALMTDVLDGYLARRYRWKSRLGTLLDPLMDKFFVIFTLGILFTENRIQLWKAATMLCRDFAIIIFGAYLTFTGTLSKYKLRAIWCGKITTFLQLMVLLGLTYHFIIPDYIFFFFIILGVMALIELYVVDRDPHYESS